MVQVMSAFCRVQLTAGQQMTTHAADVKTQAGGSVGLIARNYWAQLSKLQTTYQQMLSEVLCEHYFMFLLVLPLSLSGLHINELINSVLSFRFTTFHVHFCVAGSWIPPYLFTVIVVGVSAWW